MRPGEMLKRTYNRRRRQVPANIRPFGTLTLGIPRQHSCVHFQKTLKQHKEIDTVQFVFYNDP